MSGLLVQLLIFWAPGIALGIAFALWMNGRDL